MKVLCELHHLELALAPKGLDNSVTYLPFFHFEMTHKVQQHMSSFTWPEKHNLFPFVSFLNFQNNNINKLINNNNPQIPVFLKLFQKFKKPLASIFIFIFIFNTFFRIKKKLPVLGF